MDQIKTRLLGGKTGNLAVLMLMSADVLALITAIFLTLRLHFDTLPLLDIITRYLQPHLRSLLLVLPLYVLLFASFRLYRYAWRFASLETMWGIIYANTLGLAALILLQVIIERSTFPFAVLIVIWLLSIFAVGAIRILLRLANLSRSYGRRTFRLLRKDTRPTRVLILGGGSDGARLLSALHEDVAEVYDVIGILDDRPQRTGLYIRNVPVLGPLKHLEALLLEGAVDEVLIAIPDASGAQIREYVMACRQRQVPVKIIPGVSDVLNRKAHARLEEISVEDLLRRPPFRRDLREIGKYLTGKTVLVTGAGGSIGSELCRQILAVNPASLVLLGHGENSLHKIQQELIVSHPEYARRIHTTVGSVADDVRVEQIFQQHRPQVVFHAAAHKHVPIMEINVPEAVQNNVMGTRCIAEACGRYHVKHMVLISTDKAVLPSSVMGATKWLCEEVVRMMAAHYPETGYVTVRFGNVLGSRGSVVPLFHDMIKRGGPVIITHPEVTRFFMTIPEAVQLVLQAGAVGQSGELYVLDMGEPVKILDLATDMIRLCGYEPDADIRIKYSGLRPGEKLHEQLAADDELMETTDSDGLSVVHRPQYFTPASYRGILRRLQQLASSGDTEQLLDYLGEIVPSFASQRLLTEALHPANSAEATARS